METSNLCLEKRTCLLAVLKAAALAAALGTSLLFAQSQPAETQQSNQPTTAATVGRRPIQTKTKEEYQAYQVAIANSLNPEAMEKAANDFATQFPNSDVRVLLYRAAMGSYQSIGNLQKMMDMGLKVLAIDKDDPEALIGVAEDMEEHTSPTDLDRQQRGEQAIECANHALKTIDTDLAVPTGTPPEKIEAYKRYLRATALGIIGTIYYKQEKYPEAETKLRESIDADPANPDAVTILRLALALDQQKKYDEALERANRAVELTKPDTQVGNMARNERDRLANQKALSGAGSAPTPVPSPTTPPPNTTNGTEQGSGPKF